MRDHDDRLMTAAAAGDDEAFHALTRRHRPRLESFARRFVDDGETARDLAQETLIRLWRGAERYHPDGRFIAYLYTIARNVCRSRASRLGSEADEHDVAAAAASSRAETGDERADAVKRAVRGLPERYREVVILSVYEELSYDQIARVIGCPRGTVASRKAAAIRLLRERLAALLPERGDP